MVAPHVILKVAVPNVIVACFISQTIRAMLTYLMVINAHLTLNVHHQFAEVADAAVEREDQKAAHHVITTVIASRAKQVILKPNLSALRLSYSLMAHSVAVMRNVRRASVKALTVVGQRDKAHYVQSAT